MSAIPQVDPFVAAHRDAKKAVATFLPSLSPAPAPPPQPPPRPMPPKMAEAVRAASIIRKVEMASQRVARGMPAEPPPPPSPQETFGPEIDPVHIRAIASAIAAHPETERAALLHELADNLTKWISGNNGRVVVDGKMEIAHSPQSAETLSVRIVNEAVNAHDEREQAKREAALGLHSAGDKDSRPDSRRNPVTDQPRSDRVEDRQSGADRGSNVIGANEPSVPSEVLSPVGSVDRATGRTVTQSTDDLGSAQDTATASAPELKDTLSQAVDGIPDAEVDGVREEKDPERAQQKEEVDEKPVHTQTDLLAGRIAVDSPEAKDAVVDQLKSSAPVIDEDDKFKDGDPNYGFRAHTLQVALGNGRTSAEVQVVPKEIADVDDDTHDTYERGRQAEAEGDDKTAKEAMDENKSAHDAAMDKFNERNQDRGSKIVDSLGAAGFKVRGKPVKIGGHLFVPVVDDDGD